MLPVEFDLERKRIRRNLMSDIAQAVWRSDQNWEKVEVGFKRLKASFLKMIPQLDIPQSIADDWLKRVSEIQLALPGSFPRNRE